MKKHFLRILTVLLMACLGVGVLAACGGDPENPQDPEDQQTTPQDRISGVWTNETVTITIENNRAVMKDLGGDEGVEYSYYALTAADGYYTAGENKRFTPTGAGLTVQLPSIDENGDPTSVTLTFTTHTEQVPAHVTLSGTYLCLTDPNRPDAGGQTIDFTGGTIDGNAVTFIQVGEYTVVEQENPLFASMDIFFQTGDQVFVSLYLPDFPGGQKAEALQPAASSAADPLEGVWTGATASNVFGEGTVHAFSILIDLDEDGDSGFAVLAADRTTEGANRGSHFRIPFPVTKSGDDYTGLCDGYMPLTITLAENKVTVTGFENKGTKVPLTFAKKDALPATIEKPTGVQYVVSGETLDCTIDFTNNTMEMSGKVVDVTFVNIGNYIAMATPDKEVEIMYYAISRTEDGTYQFYSAEGAAREFSTTKPAQKYEIRFDLGNPNHAQGQYTFPTTESGKSVGDKVELPATDPTPADGWEFLGWYTESGRSAKGADGKYTVAEADDVNEDGIIHLIAKWGDVSAPAAVVCSAPVGG